MTTPFDELEELYRKLPRVNCQCCGGCCVSPNCTLVEFVVLMRHAVQTHGPQRLGEIILKPPEIHPDYEGNCRCMFLADSRCSVHPGRCGACRLFGIPALAALSIQDLTECKRSVTVDNEPSGPWLQAWLDSLTAINARLHPFGEEPYFVRGFSLACWFDLYFDIGIRGEPFDRMRSVIRENIDLSFVNDYRPATGLKEKIDKITLFFCIIGSGDRAALRDILISIRDDYPLTGTYFYDEANIYLKALEG